jgi:multicomponent Na+:H+ antiporter subunit C
MQDFIKNIVQPHFNYWVYVILMMIGLWAIIAKNNLIKKLIGVSIFQTAIILFYISLGVKSGSTIPIVEHHAAPAHAPLGNDHPKLNASQYANPLPHVLMLTAIVVGVATLGVGLAVAQSIFKTFGTLEENEIIEKMATGDYHD